MNSSTSFDHHHHHPTINTTTLFTSLSSHNMNLNALPNDHINNNGDSYPNDNTYHPSSCHNFFNYYDPPRFFHPHQYQLPDDGLITNFDNYNGEGEYNAISNNLELSLWQKGEHHQLTPPPPDQKAPHKPKKMKNPTLTTPRDVILKPASSPETDQFSSSSSISNNNSSSAAHSPIRVCSDCNTTKTPLWRSGPKGPKSLCNACGIRQRKAKRAMAAAAAAAGSGTNQITNAKVQQGKEKMLGPSLQHVKKRSRTKTPKLSLVKGEKKECLEDVLINLSKKLAVVHRVFPEEEKDAAILLMALSYGLIHG